MGIKETCNLQKNEVDFKLLQASGSGQGARDVLPEKSPDLQS